MMPKSV
jgi:hypothetical protein